MANDEVDEESSDDPDQHEGFDDYFEASDSAQDEPPVYTGGEFGCSCSVGADRLPPVELLASLLALLAVTGLRRQRHRASA